MIDNTLQAIWKRAQHDERFREKLLTTPLEILQEYALTDEQIHEFILPNFGWFVENKIAGSSFPRSEDAFTLLKTQGIKALLNLSEHALPEERLNRFGMQVKHIPLADFSAPTISEIEQAITAIEEFLKQEQPVAVHCRAGLGRTGTILACYLVQQGMHAQEAIQHVRTTRPGSIETAGQEAIIATYELHLGMLNRVEAPSQPQEEF